MIHSTQETICNDQ